MGAAMSRVTKGHARPPLDLGSMSRADLKRAMEEGQVPRQQRALVDLFLKYSETRPEARLSPELAVALARAHLVAKYDLLTKTMTRAEQQLMAFVGKRVSDLVRALKAEATDADMPT
jgi:hypothetical protein